MGEKSCEDEGKATKETKTGGKLKLIVILIFYSYVEFVVMFA